MAKMTFEEIKEFNEYTEFVLGAIVAVGKKLIATGTPEDREVFRDLSAVFEKTKAFDIRFHENLEVEMTMKV